MGFSTIYLIILVLASISFLSVVVLSVSHLMNGSTCPKVLEIPACYILIFLVGFILISHLNYLKDYNILFFGGAGLTILIAIYASISHIKGTLECPKLFGTIPMCYLSLLTFGIVTVLKIIEIIL